MEILLWIPKEKDLVGCEGNALNFTKIKTIMINSYCCFMLDFLIFINSGLLS